jgi:hypothetical protein
MLLLAEGLFRLDVVPSGDTMRTVVRNLSPGELEMEDGLHPETEPHLAFGEVAPYEPGKGRIGFTLGRGSDRVTVNVIMGTLRFPERGTLRITAQAIIRQERSAA